MAWTFTKRTGAPAGPINITIGGNTYLIDDVSNTTITTNSADDARELISHTILQQSGGGLIAPTPHVLEQPVIVDGVLSKPGPAGSYTSLGLGGGGGTGVQVYSVSSDAAMLALAKSPIPIAIRTDLSPQQTFMYNGGVAGNDTDWTKISSVTLVPSDLGAASTAQLTAAQATVLSTFGNMTVYGHSYAAGGITSSYDLRYSSIVAARLGLIDDGNYAVSGSYLGWDSSDGVNGGVSYIAQREKRNVVRAPYSPGRDLVILNFGYEDIMLGLVPVNPTVASPVLQDQTIFKNSLRAALSILRSSRRSYAAATSGASLDSSIALGTPGNWTAVPQAVQGIGTRVPNAVSGSSGYITTTTNGSGGAVAITIPGDYPGSAVTPLSVIMVADPATTAGTITASGAATGTFDIVQQVSGGTPSNTSGTCDAVNSKRNLIAFRFTGAAIAASNGTTQTLTLTPSSLAGGTWGLAEWIIEADTPPLIVMPQLHNFGNPGLVVFQSIRNSDITAFNTVISSLITAEFNDGTVITSTVALGGSGNTLGLNGTSGNSTAATAITSNGATGFASASGTTGCQVSSVADPGSSGGLLAIQNGITMELVSFTGRTGSSPTWTLTGVVRGAYNSGANAFTGSPLCDLANSAALVNWAPDSTHPSDRGHALYAQSILSAIQPASIVTTRAKTSQKRARAYGRFQNSWGVAATIAGQIIAPQGSGLGATTTLLKWDQTIEDSIFNHYDTNSILGSNDYFTIPGPGYYAVDLTGVWSAGKCGANSAALSGVLATRLLLNGNTIRQDNAEITSANYPNATFIPIRAVHFEPVYCVTGDRLQLSAYQSGAGASTTLATALTDTTGTTVVLTSATGIVANDILRIDDEQILLGTLATNTFSGCTRGYARSTPATHIATAPAFTGRALCGALTTPATTLTIRRVATN